MNTSTTNNFKAEKINDDYEWLQYNEHLRIIHSIKDDMFQAQSIINACHSNKQFRHWFDNESTKELLVEWKRDDEHQKLAENSSGRILPNEEPYEKRMNLPINLKGYYIHRLLVNHVAMWASPKYSLYIMKLLDNYFEKQREELTKKIDSMKPRMVPKGKDKSYKYMIYLTDAPPDDESDNKDMVILNLVRRNNSTFREVNKIKNSDKCWFYRDNLPVAMTPNEDIKQIVKMNLKGSEYDIKGTTILTYKEHLDLLKEKITEYFENFQ